MESDQNRGCLLKPDAIRGGKCYDYGDSIVPPE